MSRSPCARCAARPRARVLHPVAIHFKGSGFYSTDYGRGGKKPALSADGKSSEGSKSDSGSDGKSDGKGSGSGEGGSKPAKAAEA